ncbi:MAG TPA: glycosyltransferase family 4 protein [bacterium]|nr:glycosyltransferase family 4 protein [bacterium]
MIKINIILNIGKKPSGAGRPIIEFSNQLYKNNSVVIYKPFNPEYKKGVEYKFREIIGYILKGREYKQKWIECKPKVFIIPKCKEKFIRDADILFFRSPKFLEEIGHFSLSKGKKVMRVSDIFFALNPPKNIPSDIYIITSSTMVKSLLQQKFPDKRIFLVVNGVNLNFFGFPERKPIFNGRIGMVYYSGKNPEHKGMEDGFWVMNMLKEKYPSLEFYLLGWEKEKKIPPFVKFTEGLTSEKVREFYRQIDILIYPSKLDACPNPPMEGMASKCAVITTNVGGIADFVIPGVTALVNEPGEKAEMLKNAIALIENKKLWEKISNAGYEKIKEFSYEKQGQKLENVFLQILNDKN